MSKNYKSLGMFFDKATGKGVSLIAMDDKSLTTVDHKKKVTTWHPSVFIKRMVRVGVGHQ